MASVIWCKLYSLNVCLTFFNEHLFWLGVRCFSPFSESNTLSLFIVQFCEPKVFSYLIYSYSQCGTEVLQILMCFLKYKFKCSLGFSLGHYTDIHKGAFSPLKVQLLLLLVLVWTQRYESLFLIFCNTLHSRSPTSKGEGRKHILIGSILLYCVKIYYCIIRFSCTNIESLNSK